MRHHLDWSGYENAGQGDAYAGIPAHGGDFAQAVAVCIGDGLCQRKPKGVMCPSFRVTDDVAESPGGRVKVLKAALNGEWPGDPFTDPRLAAAMTHCVGCKGCKRECANQVDMAALKIEVLAQRNARLGVSPRDRLFAGLPRWLAYRRLLRGLVRWRNRSPWLARLGERWLGIAAATPLPEPAARAWTEPGETTPTWPGAWPSSTCCRPCAPRRTTRRWWPTVFPAASRSARAAPARHVTSPRCCATPWRRGVSWRWPCYCAGGAAARFVGLKADLRRHTEHAAATQAASASPLSAAAACQGAGLRTVGHTGLCRVSASCRASSSMPV